MEITVSDAGEVKVVRIEGELDTVTSPEAEAKLTQLVDQGVKKIVINFEKLEYINSAGLRVLLMTAKQLNAINGELRVSSLNEDVREIFRMAGFTTILRVKPTEKDALEGF